MSDIPHSETVKVVEPRLEGQGNGGGREQPARKAAASYAEAARTRTDDDRITILGIPFEQITPATQAALAGLVAEINYLRGLVKRLERSTRRPSDTEPPTSILEPGALLRAVDGVLAQTPEAGASWVLVLVYVSTYADIRRSSGVLAANATMADVAQRLREMEFRPTARGSAGHTATQRFDVLGYAGGGTLAGVVALPIADLDPDLLAEDVRTKLLASAYTVAGIDMTLAISTAAAPVGVGESALLALARTDHLLLRPRGNLLSSH